MLLLVTTVILGLIGLALLAGGVFLVALGIGLVLLVFCHRTFVRLQGNFAQEL